ncbi:ABC transporter ATP-binding protein [Afifella marina]|uniref:NitT/TauT family transport system ATP-binding protein n=1 Tax=Afifella marina DSM 2698 TaxID=1120955 RepID=A0A1G5NXG0_AFIMA|nr:ABC transporter ATP-binding protein [Afifella marina]MBK1624486.1 ABC transporter ATP-binding protein [Afifella marina DSM 2698]MBK1628218.1 ABC transporter ATP-binding protein [Afifella marina]MBK5916652.1 ABC transporter ATP-binding protein [Afifella marina]RAI19004.1 ABC transporter ATP-binding protein [Afifella marina DSM 2698]SCZ42026.1 NitT/TauT family transport system ATP-binding protein [Afifella marina DSM 2698]
MEPALDFSAVNKTFTTSSGPVKALDDVSFSIAEGEFLAVLGPSGCGKSTLLSLAAGLERPTSGGVKTAGRVIDRAVTDIGIVFQTDALLDWRSVLQNVMIQPQMRGLRTSEYEGKARELLELVGLAGFEEKYPYELSGGMRQRVSICRALVHNPSLLLMDEPFGALDALTREQMVMELHHIWLRTHKSVMFVTHDIQEAVLLAQRVLVMTPRPGRIAEIIEVDLPLQRTPDIMESEKFTQKVAHIRHLFEAHGVLKKY